MSKRTLYRITAGVALLNVLVWGIVCFEEIYKNRIMPGAVYAGVSVGGKTVEAAQVAIMGAQDKILGQPIEIVAEEVRRTIIPTQLGARFDPIELTLALEKQTKPTYLLRRLTGQLAHATSGVAIRFATLPFDSFINDLKQAVDLSPKDAGLDFQNDILVVVEAQNGRKIDKDTVKAQLTASLSESAPATIVLVVEVVTPALTDETQLEAAKTSLTALLAQPLILKAGTATLSLAPKDIFAMLSFGVSNNSLAYDIDQEKATQYVSDLGRKVYIAPISKQVAANGSVLVEGKDGQQLDKLSAYKAISQAVINPTGPTVTLTTSTLARKVSTDSGDFYDQNRGDGRYIDLSLSKQRMALIDNQQLVKIYAVSTGKWNTPTPIGEFSIKNHIPTARSSLFPQLYMDDWMAITSNGDYGIHRLPRYKNGAWIEDPAHIGKPLSHGCIRLAPGESSEVYNWAVNGTKVFIHE